VSTTGLNNCPGGNVLLRSESTQRWKKVERGGFEEELRRVKIGFNYYMRIFI